MRSEEDEEEDREAVGIFIKVQKYLGAAKMLSDMILSMTQQ